MDSVDEHDAFTRDSVSVPVDTVVEPGGSAFHSGALTTAIEDDDRGTAHDSRLGVVGPIQQFGRFTTLAEPTKPRSRRLVLVSSTQVDMPTTVPDSVDVVHVNLTDGDVGALSDTESNRTVPADGTMTLRKKTTGCQKLMWVSLGVRKSLRKTMFYSVFQGWPL